MDLFDKFFGKLKVQCPRCLGKGYVDQEDIKRLKKELQWVPDTCMYCNGKGEVDAKLPSKIAVDSSYLTTNLTYSERKKFINNDEATIRRANFREAERDKFIAEVEYLYFSCDLSPSRITEFYLLHLGTSEIDTDARFELESYINKIIEHRKRN